MLVFAGSTLSSRRLWPHIYESSRKTATLSKVNLQRFEAGISQKDVTQEHLETLRNLSSILTTSERHNLPLREDGLLSVSCLLQHPLLANSSFKCLDDILRWDKQRRFELLYRPRVLSPPSEDWWIRIRKGYDQNKELSLRRITSSDQIPLALHSTTSEGWESIEQFGLSRGDAPYLRFSTSIPGRETIFGKNPRKAKHLSSSTSLAEIQRPHVVKVLVYIDAAKAMDSGIPFYSSKDNTIATPGNDYGIMEPQFFRRVDVTNIRMKRVLYPSVSKSSEKAHLGKGGKY